MLPYTYLALAAAAVFITFEVISRYGFNVPHDWFDEIVVVMVLLGVFLGSIEATDRKRHISLELLYVRFSTKWRRWVDKFNTVMAILANVVVFICLVSWASFLNSINAHYESSLATPYSLVCYAISVGMVLNILGGLRLLLGPLAKYKI